MTKEWNELTATERQERLAYLLGRIVIVSDTQGGMFWGRVRAVLKTTCRIDDMEFGFLEMEDLTVKE